MPNPRPLLPRLAPTASRLIGFSLLLLLPAFTAAAPLPTTPEQMLRQLTVGLLRGDRQAVQALTRGDPQAGELGDLEPALERAQRLEADPDELTIELLRPYEVGGERVANADPGTLPPGATALVAATLQGGQTQIWRLVRSPQGWQADLRWARRARTMAEQGEALEQPGSPPWVARQLTMALLRGDRQQALPLLLPGADPDLVFLGAPEGPDPSGHLLALAQEMPLVRLEPGEAVSLPDGRVVLANDDPDRHLLLGLFGVSEIPFLLQRSNGSWRVEPQPWLQLLMR